MAKLDDRIAQPEPTFTFDGDFIKREAREALKSYFFPLSGLYAAVTGREVIFIKRDARGRIVRDREPEKKRA
jgi:hypothetical protein